MFLLFYLLWFLFNSRVTPEIALFGLAVCGLCYGLTCALFGFNIRKDLKLMRKIPGILKLGFTLIAEIWKANLWVIRAVYSRKPTEPAFVTFEAPLKRTGSQVALADCITLTPGTITGLQEGNRYTVHCLDRSLADGLKDSVFVRQLRKLEQNPKENEK